MTAENAYDLLPTIRSRAVPFHFTPLAREEMQQFVRARGLDQPERRVAHARERQRPERHGRLCLQSLRESGPGAPLR